MTRSTTLLCLSALAFAATACGSADDEDRSSSPPADGDLPMGPGLDEPQGPTTLEDGTEVLAVDGYELPQYATSRLCENSPETGYAGDDFCIEAPLDGNGFQVHYGPDAYDDPDELAKWLVMPGDELVDCVFRKTPNVEDVFVSTYHARLRPGTHHMITYTQGELRDDSPYPEDCRQGADFTFLVGATTPVTDIGASEQREAPEDQGLALKVAASSQLAVQMHYVNVTDAPILKEGWINAVYTPPEDVRQLVGPVTWIGGLAMAVPPQTSEVVKSGGPDCNTGGTEYRIVELVAHAHANTARVASYHHKDGSPDGTLVYETYDWAEPGFLGYNSIVQNPAPDPTIGTLGGASGQLVIGPNDYMSWECEVHNEWADITLTFGDKAYEGEMCNMFGVYTAAPESSPWRCFSP